MQVGKGSQSEVPDVIGQTARQAQQDLAQAGFRNLSFQVRQVNDRDQDGRVVDQSVNGGRDADPNEQIVLTVGQFANGVSGNSGPGN